MVFIGYLKKLNSELILNFKIYNQNVIHNGENVGVFEISGFVLSSSAHSATICDFYGIVEIHKKPELKMCEKSSFVFRVKPYVRNERIVLFCKDCIKVSIYEEIAFNLEVKALVNNLY